MNIELMTQSKQRKLDSWAVSKDTLAQEWIKLNNNERNKFYGQGQVVMCEFGENIGYEICDWRPVLVISDNWYNKNGQVVVVPLTKNNRQQKTHYILKKNKYDFLTFDSTAKTEQIKSISTIRLRNIIGKINDEDLSRVKVRLKTLFNI